MIHATEGDYPLFPPKSEEQSISTTVTICNQRGLHARAAAKLVALAGQFTSTIEICNSRMVVSCHSILGLMMLSASVGSTIEIKASGADAAAAITALTNLINRRFDED